MRARSSGQFRPGIYDTLLIFSADIVCFATTMHTFLTALQLGIPDEDLAFQKMHKKPLIAPIQGVSICHNQRFLSVLSPAKKILNVSFNFFLAPLIALVTTLLLLLRLLQFLLWL